jgi:hypothetical protein
VARIIRNPISTKLNIDLADAQYCQIHTKQQFRLVFTGQLSQDLGSQGKSGHTYPPSTSLDRLVVETRPSSLLWRKVMSFIRRCTQLVAIAEPDIVIHAVDSAIMAGFRLSSPSPLWRQAVFFLVTSCETSTWRLIWQLPLLSFILCIFQPQKPKTDPSCLWLYLIKGCRKPRSDSRTFFTSL